MTKKILSLGIANCLFFMTLQAQVAINGNGAKANSNSMLDVQSNSKGMLLPRMTTAQRNTMEVSGSNDVGLLVYDTDKHRLYMYDGNFWLPLSVENKSGLMINNVQTTTVISQASYGHAVAIDGDYAVVGSISDSVGNNHNQGSAQVLKRVNGVWLQQAELTAADGTSNSSFGYSVDISGNYIIIGAKTAPGPVNITQGAAYVYELVGNDWIQRAKLTDNNNAVYYGCSVAINGNTAVVGAYGSKVGTNIQQGAAYAYYRNGLNWNFQSKLISNDGTIGDFFGTSVDVYGDYIVVGAPSVGYPNSIFNAGAAYIFSRNYGLWSQQTKIQGIQQKTGRRFGASVSIYQDEVAIGGPYDYSDNYGVVQMYSRSGITWAPIANMGDILSPSQNMGDTYRLFGANVSLSNGYLMVNSPYEQVNGMISAGACFILKRRTDGSYGLAKRVIEPDGFYYSVFGFSCALDETGFIIGTPGSSGFNGKVSLGTIE
ncbi:MAG: hypothetical protein V4722_21935 [Bacteroidota bacterium]